MGLSRVRLHYVNGADAAAAIERIVEMRKSTGAMPVEPERPAIPRALVEMHRLLSEPSRGGRMRSAEMAAAMAAYEIITVTDADREGHEKTDDQIRQEQLAALVRPFGVRTRPDPSDGNRMAYWLTREHRDYGDVGVAAALDRAERGRLVPDLGNGYSGSRDGSQTGSRRLRVVRSG